ncbi:hypothetical protein F0562_030804 [Nyssa sinensis]|uniref:Uncharacterized protein n=1 Tax=Nyssa sinensis TaxID=561372 RepID=A0A5J5AXF3_9ASTE|nr:hypothetical protein F0562_030804 [Nyssa sinensis]
MDEAPTHNTYSTHSWADRVEQGEYIPQAALDLEAKFGGFSEDLSFLMESLPGDSSTPSSRGRRSLNNGSHRGHGGRGRGARMAFGIQDRKPFFNSFHKAAYPKLLSAYVSSSKVTVSLALGIHKVGACGEQLVGNRLSQGGDVKAIQGRLATQKRAFSYLMCGSKELSHTVVKGGNIVGVKGDQPLGTKVNQGGGVSILTATKSAFLDLKCGNKGLSPIVVEGNVGLINTVDGLKLWQIRWAAMVVQWAAKSFYSPIISNANISNVHGDHDFSALLLESQLDDISEGVDGVARDEASIHNTYSPHSWADRVEEGEYIP